MSSTPLDLASTNSQSHRSSSISLTLLKSIQPTRSEVTHVSLSPSSALAIYPTTNQTTQSWIDTFSLPDLKALSKTSGSQAVFSPLVTSSPSSSPLGGLGSRDGAVMATLKDWTVQLGGGVEYHHTSTVLLKSVLTGKCSLEIKAARSAPLAFSACGQYLAAGDGPSTERLGVFNVSTGAKVGMVTGHIDKITHAAFLSDGSVVTCARDGVLRITDWKRGKTLYRLETDSFNPRMLCIPAVGNTIISIWGRNVYTWHPATSNISISSLSALRSVEGWPLAFSADGRYLACRTEDGFDIMEVASGAVVAEHKDDGNGMVTAAAFSADRGLLFVGYMEGRLELWKVGRGKN